MKSVAAAVPLAGLALEYSSALARLSRCNRELHLQAGRPRGSPLEDSSATIAPLARGSWTAGISYRLVHLAHLPPIATINRIAFLCSRGYRQSTGENP